MRLILRWARGVFPLAWLLSATFLYAQPDLATIEDTIYRADGQRFSGTLLIEWRSFLAADSTSIAAYSKNARVLNGILKVSLVPTTTASVGAYYLVKYTNNGRTLFTEYWGVKPSASSLKLKDIRLTGPPVVGAPVTLPPTAGDLEIVDIPGLADELAARPKKGIGYLPSRTAIINSSGDLDGAVGQPTDCVHVNGTSGPCTSAAALAFIDAESPAGLINGSNSTFTLSNSPQPASSLQLYKNGVFQKTGIDFNVSGTMITFVSGAVPQIGDTLTASYRIAGAGAQTGGGQTAGGALTGYFPEPSIADGAIANQHIASNAGIVESKLALNFSTHSSANDPSTDQKSALTGTAGSPSNTNRFVTDQDSRLTNSRTPTGHALLGSAHYDASPAVVSRGDLIVGAGTAPTLWNRLALGAPNRCLISNGFDAVWNACLFTGYPAGSIPFVDSSGNLAHSNTRLFWDNTTRRLGIGMNTPTATVSIHDSSAGDGQTSVQVRAGQGQGAAPLQRWQSYGSTDLARIEADGQIVATAMRASSSSSRAAWQETGSALDPTTPGNGDQWLNTTEQARKSYESGQTHTFPQVICSIAGMGTSQLTMTSLGKCHVPSGMIRTGDRFEIRYELSHEGSSAAFSYSLAWGATTLAARSGAGGDAAASGRCDALPQSDSLYWGWQNWGAVASVLAGSGFAGSLPAGPVDIEVKAQMSTTTSETVTLRNLSVIRIPAQTNP